MKTENPLLIAAYDGFFNALELGWMLLRRTLKLVFVLVVAIPYVIVVGVFLIFLTVISGLCFSVRVPFLTMWQIENLGEFFFYDMPDWFRDWGEK